MLVLFPRASACGLSPGLGSVGPLGRAALACGEAPVGPLCRGAPVGPLSRTISVGRTETVGLLGSRGLGRWVGLGGPWATAWARARFAWSSGFATVACPAAQRAARAQPRAEAIRPMPWVAGREWDLRPERALEVVVPDSRFGWSTTIILRRKNLIVASRCGHEPALIPHIPFIKFNLIPA